MEVAIAYAMAQAWEDGLEEAAIIADDYVMKSKDKNGQKTEVRVGGVIAKRIRKLIG